MIALVTGPPGAGKSYYALRKLAHALDAGRPVATNVELAPDFANRIARNNPFRRLLGRVPRATDRLTRAAYVSDNLSDLFALRLRGRGEGRGVMVLDEAHGWLNARNWTGESRGEVIRFFTQHRKLGWDVFLIVQDAEMIDKQVRALIEYHIHLRNLRRARIPFIGIPFSPVNLFLALWTWHGTRNSVVRREVYRLGWHRKLYDTHQTHFGLEGDELDGAVWLPRLPAGPSADAPEAQAAGDTPGNPGEHPEPDEHDGREPGEHELAHEQPEVVADHDEEASHPGGRAASRPRIQGGRRLAGSPADVTGAAGRRPRWVRSS